MIKEKRKVSDKPTLSDAKIKKLLDFEHIEELYFLLGILSDDEIDAFITHYKNATLSKSAEPRLDSLIKGTTKSYELTRAIREELSKRLIDEYDTLRSDMRTYRKRGVDVFLEDVSSMQIPLKMRLFKATGKKEDFYKVKKMIATIREKMRARKEEYVAIENERRIREEAHKKQEQEERLKKEAQEEKKNTNVKKNKESYQEKVKTNPKKLIKIKR